MNHLEKRKQAESMLRFVASNLSNLSSALRRTGSFALANSLDVEINDIVTAHQLFSEAHQELFDDWFSTIENSHTNILSAVLSAIGGKE
jgi:hypothetical protein